MDDPAAHNPARSALLTDLYELTMAQAYHAEAMDGVAVFELYFRALPAGRNFVMAAGLEAVLDYLEHLRFTEDDLAYLAGREQFGEAFIERLRSLRFTGDVYAAAEGTVVFAYEPIVQVVAPVIEAQLIETAVLNQIHVQTIAATKAARVVLAAAGRTVVDFGSRRAHGVDAALAVARCSYLAGAAGTSNVLAGRRFGVPLFGTMAHSYIQAHDDEAQAFERFASLYPGTTLLVDTYDTLEGVRRVIALAQRLGEHGRIGAIRLDSGDLGALAKQARRLLDEAGLRDVRIIASGGLDEYKIAALAAEGAPIDGFGIGTKMAVSDDAPQLDLAYKLVEYDGEPRTKLSSEKAIYPGRKQVFRQSEGEGDRRLLRCDTIGRHDEDLEGEGLLRAVMRRGERLEAGRVTLDAAREHAAKQIAALPRTLRAIEQARPPYPVNISAALRGDLEALAAEHDGGGDAGAGVEAGAEAEC